MKVQVVYSSLTGSTKKLAEGIFEELNCDNKTIHDLKEGEPILDGDIILLGYWVDKGTANKQMIDFMHTIKGKVVGVFCTLAYYCDAGHGVKSLQNGIDLVKENNTILGSYVCNGALSEGIIERFRLAPEGTPHSATPEKELRWDVMKSHPTNAEIALGAERFSERLELFRQFNKQGLEYKSVI